ncbi:MAG: hypothetical protein M3411_03735 [Chloroflexota bacterium]|nr:hypothetical protein [Chloroflexota bacterium]
MIARDPLMPAARGFAVVPIAWRLPDGTMPRGQQWGEGESQVLLLHAAGSDLDAWGDLPPLLAARGFRVQTVDLPGHGLSDGPWQPDRLAAIVRWLTGGEGETVVDDEATIAPRRAPARQSGRVLERVSAETFVVGAGTSADAALRVAADGGIDGLVAMSPTAEIDAAAGWSGVPKLIVASSLASDEMRLAKRLAQQGGGWTMLSTIPVAASGTALLDGAWGAQVREQVVSFLRDCQRRRRRAAPAPDSAHNR